MRDFDLVLVFGGGNALGAFQAGVYEALHEHGLVVDWIIGASIGAINAALITGSAPDRRIDTLRAFWQPAPSGGELPFPWLGAFETSRRTNAVGWAATLGRPGMFGPMLSAVTAGIDNPPSIFETSQLAATLEKLVDFDRLNAGPCRYTATAVDLETGADVVFDNGAMKIGADHVRASAALPVAYPPIEIDGRWCVDGGLSANLPLDPVLGDPPPRPTLCIAVDLLPLHGPRPTTLGEATSRVQDLIFAAQSRRTIERWQDAHVGRKDFALSLVRLPYTDQADEVAGKALDFSGRTIEQRWVAGRQAGIMVIAAIEGGGLPIGIPGLQVVNIASGASTKRQ